jgi:hypothetical protein
MPVDLPARRLTAAVSLALALLALALTAPSQTLAHARKPACSAARHSKGKPRKEHGCAPSSHRGRRKGHSTNRHAKHTIARRGAGATQAAPAASTPASCEDGGAPVRAANGSFSCLDGSDPECEDGSTPSRSGNGISLVCLVSAEAGSESGESECEEGPAGLCEAGDDLSASEHPCQASSGDGSSFVCEDEG